MILPYFVLIPVSAAILITIFCRNGKRPAAWIAVFASAALLTLAIISFILVSRANAPLLYNLGNWKIPLTIGFVVDYLASFMLIVVNLITVAAMVFAMDYITHYTDPWKFFALLFDLHFLSPNSFSDCLRVGHTRFRLLLSLRSSQRPSLCHPDAK